MKKIMFIGASVVAVIGCYYMSTQIIQDKNTVTKQHADSYVAIFTPITHPALQEVEQAFKQTMLEDGQSYRFKTFNANGNRTLLRGQAEEIVSGSFDLICTLGAACSQSIAELLLKRNSATPHVFCALEGADFSASLKECNRYSTGMYVQPDYQKQIDILHQLKPDMKDVLLVYDPTHGTGLVKDKDAIEKHLASYGVQLHTVEIYQTNEIQQKVAALLPNIDVVLVLIDNTVVAGIDALVTLCNRFGVTLYASDIASGAKGAAIAYGIKEAESGIGAARKAKAILVDKQQPHEVPIEAVTQFSLAVNKDTMKTQNLHDYELERLKGIV